MFKIQRVCGALILAVGTSVAFADRPNQYFGVNGFGPVASEAKVKLEADIDDGAAVVSGESSGDVWRLKFGYEFHKFLGAEAHYGFSSNGDDTLREGALFGRFQLPFERLDVYFLAGAGRVGFSEGAYGPAAGVGIDFYGTERTALTLEYVHYELSDIDADLDGNEDRVDVDGEYSAVTLGFTHHFDWPAFR